ncbi:MAG TPA: D-alanine--D-alanine ligase [Pseudogracilibacillus sp.]|nr:D-alanine--D-alanine ligase [Pseudogracilibacillus sp.]
MKIAVLFGGVSGERDVSLASGRGVIKALKANNHEVIAIDFNPNNLSEIIELNVDLVFIALHGKHGEDGKIQSLLEMLEIPYVGSGVLASALAMDKSKAKQIFGLHGIPVAKSQVYNLKNETDLQVTQESIEANFEVPFVIKPNSEGSTLGLTIVNDYAQIKEALKIAQQSDDYAIVEQFIDGIELTVPVKGKVGQEIALPIIEIIPKNDLYDYESKYTEGGSEHIIPARIPEELTKKIQNYAVTAHQSLGCKIYSRADFILSKDNIPYILEVNTLPGMTSTSLFPDAANKIGLSYEEMIEEFVNLSIN